ncbi:MAG: EI24 domain-containing protein [Micropruina sp.]
MPERAAPHPAIPGLLDGALLLWAGGRMMLRRRQLLGLGLIPPLITSVVFVTLFAVLVWQSQAIAVSVTPFAEGWPAAEGVRLLLAGSLILAGGVLLVLSFTSVTLTIGAPLFDKISETVDADLGTYDRAPDVHPGRAVLTALRQALTVLAITVPVSVVLVVVGLVPLLGGLVAAVGSTLFGAWIIALDMTAGAADRRGLRTLKARQQLLLRHRWLALGFGIPTFWMLSIPGVALFMFPIAVAGGTLLVRRLERER